MVWQGNGKDLENLMMHGGESLLNNKKSDSPNSSVENDAKELLKVLLCKNIQMI